MKIVNYTPHTIVIRTPEGDTSYPSVGVGRAATKSTVVGYVNGVPVMEKTFGDVYGLPDYIPEDTVLIVSSLTAQAAKAHNYTYCQNLLVVNDTIRDEKGRIVACSSLAKI